MWYALVMPRFVNLIIQHVYKSMSGLLDLILSKMSQHFLYVLVQPLLILESPWKSNSLKFFNDLPYSNGSNAIDIVIDLFTKMTQFLPCTMVISS